MLEHHGDPVGRTPHDGLAVHKNLPAAQFGEPRDTAQQRSCRNRRADHDMISLRLTANDIWWNATTAPSRNSLLAPSATIAAQLASGHLAMFVLISCGARGDSVVRATLAGRPWRGVSGKIAQRQCDRRSRNAPANAWEHLQPVSPRAAARFRLHDCDRPRCCAFRSRARGRPRVGCAERPRTRRPAAAWRRENPAPPDTAH